MFLFQLILGQPGGKVDGQHQHQQHGTDGPRGVEIAVFKGPQIEQDREGRAVGGVGFGHALGDDLGSTGGEEQRGALAHDTAHSQDAAGHDAVDAAGQHDGADDVPFARAQPQCAFAVALRHRFQRFLRGADDGGQVHDDQCQAAGASNRRLIAVIEFTNETLAGIPSIIYGLVGMLVFAQTMGFKTCLLSGSLTLVVMNLPTIIRTTQESLKTVPQGYREGALGLGAGKWHIIRTIVLPCSIDGIVTGCILAVGRIVGESAALLFTAGAAEVIAGSIAKAYASNGATLSVLLYLRAFEDGDFASAWGIGAVLLVLVLLIDLAARLAKTKLKQKQ